MENQAITCVIENGNIYKLEFGQKNCIGVTAEVYTTLKNSTEKALDRNEELAKEKDKYYEMLVEHGIIQRPKTPEDYIKEFQKEQSKIVDVLGELSKTVKSINTRLEEVENGLTKPNEDGTRIGDRSRQIVPSSENV